ncbi:F-box only protein 6-like [Macadamia integrifolia]|uniref:F-box only protein 6-like n=1 Tax=Macadamia integrifolia TaxID=60698 RepID=UPI001C4E6AF7|nr:F-box only protein 6-like [Macadamia integrifolia]
MWNQLPFDILERIFSFLPLDCLARATSACKHWHTCAKTRPSQYQAMPNNSSPWFLAIQKRSGGGGHPCYCYAHNPSLNSWHSLPLDFLPNPIRPISPIGSLLLYRRPSSFSCSSSSSPSIQLALFNPFTRQHRLLPSLITPRINPAVGVVEGGCGTQSPFKVYVAGGISTSGGSAASSYEPTLEMYDSEADKWQSLGSMPIEFAVRLTVWTPNESVFSGGILYWMTSARAYSVVGFDVGNGSWKELKVPMADRLEFAALVRRKGRLALVGGAASAVEAWVWELDEYYQWELVETVPFEMGKRFLMGKRSWYSTKCVGTDEAICLYKELGSEILVWREDIAVKGRWEWILVAGCSSIRKEPVPNFPIKGILLYPSLASSYIFNI